MAVPVRQGNYCCFKSFACSDHPEIGQAPRCAISRQTSVAADTARQAAIGRAGSGAPRVAKAATVDLCDSAAVIACL
jgi:hypothetical protein